MSERENHQALSLRKLFPNFSYEEVGHYQPTLDTNPHTVVELVLGELMKNRYTGYKELFETLAKKSFNDTSEQRCRALALVLETQGFTSIALLTCKEIQDPRQTNNTFAEKKEERTVLGVTIDDVEYIISPADCELERGTAVSTLGTASHLDKNTLYIKRIITDKLREANKEWDPVALPYWIATTAENKPIAHYKAYQRKEIVME